VTEGNQLEVLGVNERVILKWILMRRVGGRGLNLFGSGQNPVPGTCQNDN
jgi:hypothetical protein